MSLLVKKSVLNTAIINARLSLSRKHPSESLRFSQSIRKNTTQTTLSSSPSSASTGKKKLIGGGLVYTAAAFSVGYIYGKRDVHEHHHHHDHHGTPPHVLPSGQPRTCCDDTINTVVSSLEQIVGRENCLPSTSTSMAPYVTGARLGQGPAICVVRPATISEAIRCLQVILDNDCVVIPQGANTGLTGGSVPRGENDQPRPAVVLNMRRMNSIHPVDDGKRLLCFAGAGIATAQKFAATFQRESHSVLGSLFLNPSVAAGLAFGSGGTQMRKGPAYTDRALYVKVKEDGKTLEVINTLGIQGFDGVSDETLLQLENAIDVRHWESCEENEEGGKFKLPAAHDHTYRTRLCDTNSSGVSRYNADTSGIEVNRSEGKVLILASVHDTFPQPKNVQTYFMTFSDFDTALRFRKEVALDNPTDLPISMEYMDRDSFDIIDRSGRILAGLIKFLGAGHEMVGTLWDLKSWIGTLPLPYAEIVCDYMLHQLNNIFPEILPKNIMYMGRASDHHIMLTVGEFDEEPSSSDNSNAKSSDGEMSLTRFQKRLADFQKANSENMTVYPCKTTSEVNAMQAFRFVAAPAFRTWCVGTFSQGISVDYALPLNGGNAPPVDVRTSEIPLKRMRYSHFGCNVVHEDLAYAAGVDVHEEKMKLKKSVEHACGGRLPAEHGHGTEYKGTEEAKERWMSMDPANVMNPGIGGLKVTKNYQ